jgi:hypothetical protein
MPSVTKSNRRRKPCSCYWPSPSVWANLGMLADFPNCRRCGNRIAWRQGVPLGGGARAYRRRLAKGAKDGRKNHIG